MISVAKIRSKSRQNGEQLLPILCLSFMSLLSCNVFADPLKLTGNTMGTTYSIVISDDMGLRKTTLLEAIEKDLRAVNDQMSTYQDDSEISLFNQRESTDWQPVSAPFVAMVAAAHQLSALSEGAYDVTTAPLIELWGFGRKPGDAIPDQALIDDAMSEVDYKRLEWRETPPALKKSSPRTKVNLSSIAKGYGVDVVAKRLSQFGLKDFLVEIGGEIKTRGKSPRGDYWRIGIEKPVADQRAVQVALQLTDVAMATSGDYRNYFEQDGVRFSHTLNPQTGYPIDHTLASVTVIADSTAMADGWSTALMVLGPEQGFKVAKDNKLAAFFLYKEESGFVERSTEAFKAYVKGRW